MWVRGLKLCVRLHALMKQEVAPHVGAWIETMVGAQAQQQMASRTPCGCVD